MCDEIGSEPDLVRLVLIYCDPNHLDGFVPVEVDISDMQIGIDDPRHLECQMAHHFGFFAADAISDWPADWRP